MNKLTEHGRRAIRTARTRPPMGAKALRRLHPWSEPRTLREPGGGRVPTFRFGASGMVARPERNEDFQLVLTRYAASRPAARLP
ncbi:MAG: hypothetical protein ACOCXM_11675 [Myxococcota bacterium]